MTTTTASQPTMGEYLVREGFITQAQFNTALAEQGNSTKSLGRILVELGLISENMRINVLQRRFGFELVRLKDFKADPAVLARIPYNFAEKHRVVPIAMEGRTTLVVAMEDPSDILITDMIKNQVGIGIRACVASNEEIQAVLDQYQTGSSEIRALQNPVQPAKKVRSRGARFMRAAGLPLLVALPMLVFSLALPMNWWGAADRLRELYDDKTVSMFDLFIYIALTWGLWSVVVYEINALIFGRGGDDEEEEA